jgi:hypothetical protein
MSPIDVYPVGKATTCAIGETGTISFHQRTLDRLGWQAGNEIALQYIASPLTLLLREADSECPGFKLSYWGRSGNQRFGGKITCVRLANTVLRSRVALPIRDIEPIVFTYLQRQHLALILVDPPWMETAFSMAGCQTLAAEQTGVYQLLSADNTVLRIGQGNLQLRLREHLKDDQLVYNTRQVRYLSMEKDDAILMERILLAQHEAALGELPAFNPIHA